MGLKGQGESYDIYFLNKSYLRSLRKLHRVLKTEGMAAAIDKIEWFVNIVKIGLYIHFFVYRKDIQKCKKNYTGS
jgi:hypothetical protein